MAGDPQREPSAVERENRALRTQLAEANTRVAELTAEVGRLTTEIARLAQAVAAGNERIAELLAIAQRKKRKKRKTPKVPSPPPALDEQAKAAFEDRPKAPELPKKKRPPKRPRRPTGRKPLPDHLESEEHTVRPPACDHCCGTALDVVDEVNETKLHTVREHVRKRVVRRFTCRCRDCGKRTTARSLPAPFARSKATPEMLAWMVHQKFGLLVPLDRTRRDLAARGVELSMSYLVTQMERAADILAIVDGEHWKQLLGSSWMATDATGLKVLIPGLPGSHYGHLEAYRNDSLVVFQYEPDKGAENLAAKLKPFRGILVADAEHRHNAVFADGSVIEAGCMAHGRRRWRDAETAQPVLAAEAGAFVAAMYVAEAEAQAAGLTGDDLRARRREKIRPLQAELLAWMDAVEPTLVPDDVVAKTIRYYRNHWLALFRFVDHPEIPIDNSGTERLYQPVAKFRANCLFAGSTEGAHRAAVLLGITATCRAIGVDPQAYMTWAFVRLGTHRDLYPLSAAQLTPAAFAAATEKTDSS